METVPLELKRTGDQPCRDREAHGGQQSFRERVRKPKALEKAAQAHRDD